MYTLHDMYMRITATTILERIGDLSDELGSSRAVRPITADTAPHGYYCIIKTRSSLRASTFESTLTISIIDGCDTILKLSSFAIRRLLLLT